MRSHLGHRAQSRVPEFPGSISHSYGARHSDAFPHESDSSCLLLAAPSQLRSAHFQGGLWTGVFHPGYVHGPCSFRVYAKAFWNPYLNSLFFLILLLKLLHSLSLLRSIMRGRKYQILGDSATQALCENKCCRIALLVRITYSYFCSLDFD